MIRSCTERDVDAVVRLATLMGRAGAVDEVGARLRRIRTLPDHLLCVADHASRVMGYAWAQDFGPHLRTGEAIVRIHDLFVEPQERRHGVGAALFTHLRNWAAERGATYLQWQASREALPFYGSLGHDGEPCPDPDHPFFEIVLKPSGHS